MSPGQILSNRMVRDTSRRIIKLTRAAKRDVKITVPHFRLAIQIIVTTLVHGTMSMTYPVMNVHGLLTCLVEQIDEKLNDKNVPFTSVSGGQLKYGDQLLFKTA